MNARGPLNLQAFTIPATWHAMVSTAPSNVQTRNRVGFGTFSGVPAACSGSCRFRAVIWRWSRLSSFSATLGRALPSIPRVETQARNYLSEAIVRNQAASVRLNITRSTIGIRLTSRDLC